MSGELSRAMNVTYGRTKRMIREENINFQNKGDLLRLLPEVLILIEQLFRDFKGRDKKMIAISAVEMLINNIIEDEQIKEMLHEFIRLELPAIIDNMIYLVNHGVKFFKKRNCITIRTRKLKNKDV